MSFLAPLYLAGLAAIAAPIIFHMIRRTPRGRMPFSTVMFLDPSPPRITREKRIEHWLLLLLRGLALTLLALAFARPFLRTAFETDSDSPQGRRVAILVDTSASMQRGDLWQDALERVETLLTAAGSEQTLSLATFDHRLSPVIGFEEWNGLPPGARADVALRRLKELAPAWGGTDLGRALVETTTAHVRDDEVGADQELDVIVVSDLQKGSRLEALHRTNWPSDARVILERVKTPQATNAGLQIAAVQEEAVASV
ncbi:MAG: alpha-1-antitrypsin, partial [Planctomycetaceae bacterium]|nr:alpha-1-antitrypsin [Planctomycetaceae bacterium]